MQERAHGNRAAATCFAVAFFLDVLDVLAHIVVVTGLLHHHFHVGLHVAHHILHGVEAAGIGIAVVSTVSAAVAELLSLRTGAGALGHTAAKGASHVKAAVHQALRQQSAEHMAAAAKSPAAGLSQQEALAAAIAAAAAAHAHKHLAAQGSGTGNAADAEHPQASSTVQQQAGQTDPR